MDGFDIFQQEAIQAQNGHHLVLAPPGCGKTGILAQRIISAHQDGVPFGEMLCLTFTNRAAKGMVERVSQSTGEPVPKDLFVGNIHKFCAQFLFENSIVPSNTAIIDDYDFGSIVHDLAVQLYGTVWSHSVSPHHLVNLQHALHQWAGEVPESARLHNEELPPILPAIRHIIDSAQVSSAEAYARIAELKSQCRYPELEEPLRMVELAQSYERYKKDNDMLDFDDLLVLAYEYVSSHPDDYHRYQWIQIDEVQDLSPAQLAIVDAFEAKENPTVVYLGDEQQAIFSFIGAKIETLELLKNRSAGNLHRLYKNYRSPKYLLDLLNTYAVRQLRIDPDVLPRTDDETASSRDTLYLLQTESYNEELDMIVRQVRGYSDAQPDSTIAVIVPYNTHADDISQHLLQAEIPHFKISGTDLFSSSTIQVLFSHLAVVINENVFTAWAKLLYHTRIIPRYTDARDFMRSLKKCGLVPTDFILYPDSCYLEEFCHLYDTEEFVIFDTETTGLDVFNDEIIQIAAVKVRNGKVVKGSQFNCFLEITKPIPPVLKGDKVNPMVEQYQSHPHLSRREGLAKFLEYSKGCVLVGHNVEYDYRILKYNLQRALPEADLHALHPRYFDTLKFIRLIQPRLRHYNLESLIDQLQLEGTNSHMADDDIMATKALLDYCRANSKERLERQHTFLEDPHTQGIVRSIVSQYAPFYLHTMQRLYELQDGANSEPLLVSELQEIYNQMVASGITSQLEKWPYVVRYLQDDLIDSTAYPSLKEQLGRYIGDLQTCREADLCGSRSMHERVFVSTVYKAKGLEFDNVVVCQVVPGKYPHSRSVTPEAVQEDARKLYVALSRSKKRLCVTSTGRPSFFLNCVMDQFFYFAKENGRWKCLR